MKITLSGSYPILSIVLLLFWSCGLNHPYTVGNVSFSPTESETYRVRISNKRIVTEQYNNYKPSDDLHKSVVDFNFTLLSSIGNEKNVIIRFNDVYDGSRLDSNGILVADSSSAMARTMALFKSRVFNVCYDDHWVVKNIDNYREFKREIDSADAKFRDKSHSKWPPVSDVIFTSEYFKNLFQRDINILPRENLADDGSWKLIQHLSLLDQRVPYEVQYKVDKVEKGIVYIIGSGGFDKEVPVMRQWSERMIGVQRSTIELDEKTRFVLHAESKLVVTSHARINKLVCLKSTITEIETISTIKPIGK